MSYDPPDEIASMLARLEPDDRELLRLRFGLDRGEPRTLEEVGEQFGLTRDQVRAREEEAMQRLRDLDLA